MKKPIILSVLFFIITAISSFGQGVWIVENVDPETGLRTGLIGNPAGDIYRIKPNAILIEADLRGADLSKTNLEGANLSQANLSQANLSRANLEGVNLEGDSFEVGS